MKALYGYRPASGLVGSIIVLLATSGLLALVGVWSGWLEIQLINDVLEGTPVDEEQVHVSDTRQAVIGAAQFLVFLVLGVLFLVWVNRANKNAHSLGADGMDFSPGWSVGWFFIPIANLYKPYQAVREIWKASNPQYLRNWRLAPSSALLGLWWTLWLISAFVGRIVFRWSLQAEGTQALRNASIAQVVSDLVDIPLAVLAMSVVRRVHTMQERKSELLADASAW